MFKKLKLFFARRKLKLTQQAFNNADRKLANKLTELEQNQSAVDQGGSNKEWDKYKQARKILNEEYEELKPQSTKLHKLSAEYGTSAHANYHKLGNKALAHEFRLKKDEVQAKMRVVDERQKAITAELRAMKNPKQVLEEKCKNAKVDADRLELERNKIQRNLEKANWIVAVLEGRGNQENVLYDRRLRNEHIPVGVNVTGHKSGDGVIYDRNDSDLKPHVTQYYDDKYRASWDNNSDDTKFHWTNQNRKKGDDKRHEPPNDVWIDE